MRYVIDEGAFPGLAGCAHLTTSLQTFSDLVCTLQRMGEQVGVVAGWASISVGDTDLGTFLMSVDPAARDVARLALIALDRCTAWDTAVTVDVDPYVTVDGAAWESFAVAYSAMQASNHLVLSCITFAHCRSGGVHTVASARQAATDVVFTVALRDEQLVHRHRFAVEDIQERDFFGVASSAFPRLAFAEGLAFRHFEGTYHDLRNNVVEHLAAINDRFQEEYADALGDLRAVSSRLGIDMSIEGSTRSSDTLMRLRDATCNGRVYRCEIHTKIERHRNRIHFHLGDADSGGRIVIGIFAKHLTT